MEWLLWIDIETTGLCPSKDKILQIACVLTTFDLSINHTFPELTLSCDNAILISMDPWCLKTHDESGLLDKVVISDIDIQAAENNIISIINQHIGLKDKLYIAGNSVHFDKHFIDHHMPQLANRLSHKIVDVSSFELVYRNLFKNIHDNSPKKQYTHTALNDILESIEEYRHYIKRLDNQCKK